MIVPLSSASRAALLDGARASLLEALRLTPKHPPPAPPDDDELSRSAGCFVSLHEKQTHRLRGCVGRLDPRHSLWHAVWETAADVLRDPRFTSDPVTLPEVPSLEIEISVLSAPRLASEPQGFDPLLHGIYLTCNDRSGFFLPQVARETGWTKEQLLSRLCTEKLSLPPDAWRSPAAQLHTFEVELIGPVPVELSTDEKRGATG